MAGVTKATALPDVDGGNGPDRDMEGSGREATTTVGMSDAS